AASRLQKELKENDTPFMRFIIASFYYFCGNLKEVKELLTAVPEDKRTIKMVRLLGSALYDMKDYSGSIDVLSFYAPPSLPTNEDELAVAFGLGVAYLSTGDKDKALDYLLRVETRNAKFGNVSRILATIDESESK
ncbi:MAG: tetratricopeptide repeat protein, partial [Caldisericaceae bacterium]